MDRIKSILTAAIVVGMLSATPAVAQLGNCGNCNTGCQSGFFGWQNQDWRQKYSISKVEWHSYKAHAEIVRQRNEAWPKPFQCHDRRVYFATFYPMYQRGFEIESTLTDAHFEKDTNQLNSAGKRKIASIMQNLPIEHRQIYIFEGGDAEMTQARVANVKVSVSEWFGHLGSPTIATTQNPAYYQSGVEVQQFNSNFLGSLPTPGITVGGGGGGDGGGN